jgi:proteic killer suppression protein
MILSFADNTTKALWERTPVRKIPVELQAQAYKRLSYLNAATRIEDLYVPPSNHFHRVGKRFAIRVNLQWRISFNWTEAGPSEARFEDSH